jgi:hypothetical protein
MNNLEIRQYDMLVRVRDFGASQTAAFPAASFGGQLFSTVNSAIAGLTSHAATQISGAARQSTASKAVARAHLLDDIEAISRTAKAMALDTPGLGDKFRLPRSTSDTALLTLAQAYLTDAQSLKVEFLKYAMAEDFLEDLQADISAFEAAATIKNTTKVSRVSATASIDETLAKGLKAVRQLQAVVKNKFRDDPSKLAAWASASHVERSSGNAKNELPPNPPNPAPTPKEAISEAVD